MSVFFLLSFLPVVCGIIYALSFVVYEMLCDGMDTVVVDVSDNKK